jgi:hypothetical protein
MLLRWLLFMFVGLPAQLAMLLLYPVAYVVWHIFILKKVPIKNNPIHQIVDESYSRRTHHNGALLDNADDHGAFTMYGFLQKEGLELLQIDGNLLRKIRLDGTINREAVSGDVVVAWFFANELANIKASDEVLKNVADSYIKNLGTLSFDTTAQGYVSARCSNFGINEAKDSDFLKLSQPAAGPQFYTNSAVFAGVYNKGFKYKALFWAHWLLMGGWYWAWAPILYPNQTDLWYVRDITMKSLYVHLQVFGPKWWITKPMEFITDKTSTHKNDLFYAMMGREIGNLPAVMNPFFSQREDASSTDSDMSGRNSAYIADAIRKIKRETRFNE